MELDDYDDTEIVYWNVIFQTNPREHWWDWLTCHQWRHCCAYGWNADRWIVFDVADTRSRIHVMLDAEFDVWLSQRMEKATAVVKFPTQMGGGLRARVGLWCVTSIKHLLGLGSSALRPKALFRDLVRQGAEVVYENGREGKSPQRKPRTEGSA